MPFLLAANGFHHQPLWHASVRLSSPRFELCCFFVAHVEIECRHIVFRQMIGLTLNLVISLLTCQDHNRLASVSFNRAEDLPAIALKTFGSTTGTHAMRFYKDTIQELVEH